MARGSSKAKAAAPASESDGKGKYTIAARDAAAQKLAEERRVSHAAAMYAFEKNIGSKGSGGKSGSGARRAGLRGGCVR